MAQMRCAIAFPLTARQWRNGARPDTAMTERRLTMSEIEA
jgi:hypothetical protein